MPFLFREGLVFMPGDRALFKPDEEHKGEPCTVNELISGEDNVLKAYRITLDIGKMLLCALDEIRLLPKE